MIGAGFMAQGLTNQIVNSVPGMRRRRHLQPPASSARRGSPSTPGRRRRSVADTQEALDDAIAPDAAGRHRRRDAAARAREHIDVLVETTGSVEFGAHVVLEAFKHGKHVVLMNAEIDATIGPILQVHAEKHGVDPLGVRRRRAGRADEPVSAGSRASA